jgi:hypothetical protein
MGQTPGDGGKVVGSGRMVGLVVPHDLTMRGARIIIEAGLIIGPAGGEPVVRRCGCVCVRRRGFCCLFDVRHALYGVKEREREDAVELGALLIRRPRGPVDCGRVHLLASSKVLRVCGGRYHVRIDSSSVASCYPHPRPTHPCSSHS